MRGRRRRSQALRSDALPLRAVVPNLVTSLAACAGISSIAFAAEGRWIHALWALVIACVCDGMDGRVARLLHASSKLGAELDSLADFVNFGVAPAMFMYFWLTGKYFGGACEVGPWMTRAILACALYYALCDCFRLARFNTMLEQPQDPCWKHFFAGIPAPGGCWLVLTPAVLAQALDAKGRLPCVSSVLQNPWLGMAVLLFVGSLMASRLPTLSLKAVRINRRYQLPVMAGLLMLVACFVANFWMTLGVLGVGYLLTVPVTGRVYLGLRARAAAAAAEKERV